MEVEIRTLGADDGPIWERLFASVAEEGRWIGAEAGIGYREFGIMERYLDREGAVLLLAEVNGTPAGWLTVDVDAEGIAELGMGVIDGFRGGGVGSQMLLAAIDWARGRAQRLRLDVFPHNHAAIALYRKFEFVEVATQHAAWPRRSGERWDLVAMERPV